MFNGPWGFLVGITQGSTSLVRNVTAGVVNSITKLSASLARNLDRLTLDSEHVQRTDAIRRSRPQGVTAGFTQGLTGLGISLLGALGGLAHHPLQANSPVQVVTGFGKGLVGAVAKPISGAAELVALTGQGVLQTVGFNSLPSPKALRSLDHNTHTTSIKFLWRQLPVQFHKEAILFSSYATLRSKEGFKWIYIIMTRSGLIIFDAAHLTKLFIFNLSEICLSPHPEDLTLVSVKMDVVEEEFEFHDEFHVSPRTIQYVQQSLSMTNLPLWSQNTIEQSEDVSYRTENTTTEASEQLQEEIHFYMDEAHAKHLVTYAKLLRRFTHLNSNEFSPFE